MAATTNLAEQTMPTIYGSLTPARVAASATLIVSLGWSFSVLAFDGPAYSTAARAGAQGDTLESIKKLPDWKGAWGLDRESFAQVVKTSDNADAGIVPFNPRYLAMHKASIQARKNGDTSGNNSATCIPNGMPNIMSSPFAFEFLFTPGQVTIIPENNMVRRVFTDGRPHPDDPDTTFSGHSIGHWEDGVLVIDTVAIKPRAELFVGMHITADMRVVERVFKNPHGRMQIDTTVYDDAMFTKPYRYSRTFEFSKAGMMEAYCTENNRDNNLTVDLTPPEP